MSWALPRRMPGGSGLFRSWESEPWEKWAVPAGGPQGLQLPSTGLHPSCPVHIQLLRPPAASLCGPLHSPSWVCEPCPSLLLGLSALCSPPTGGGGPGCPGPVGSGAGPGGHVSRAATGDCLFLSSFCLTLTLQGTLDISPHPGPDASVCMCVCACVRVCAWPRLCEGARMLGTRPAHIRAGEGGGLLGVSPHLPSLPVLPKVVHSLPRPGRGVGRLLPHRPSLCA